MKYFNQKLKRRLVTCPSTSAIELASGYSVVRVPANLEQLAEQWERLGAEDPLWAILSEPDRRGGRWGADEFFETGRQEVERILARIERVAGGPRGGALDFGCGVGRLSQALAKHFESVDGVDISSSMVEQARAFNRHGECCRYHCNSRADLSLFDDAQFDFILSAITLQHVQPDYAKAYLGEFVRVLKPGGLLYFQLPTGTSGDPRGFFYKLMPARALSKLFRLRHGYEVYEMHAVPQSEVAATLNHAGAEILDTAEDPSCGRGWKGRRYLARKPA